MSAIPSDVSPAAGEVVDDVVAAVAEVLDLPPERVDAEVPFIEQGLESFTAVRLRRLLRDATGVALALTDFLGQATARSVAAALSAAMTDARADAATAAPTESAAPTPSPATVHVVQEETFPLTPIQAAYWVGRDPAFPLGGVATFYYREYEHDTPPHAEAEVERLSAAWNVLVRRHAALRMVVDASATGHVLSDVPQYQIPITDLRDLPADEADRLGRQFRREWSHQVLPTDRWPLFDLHAVLLPTGRTRVCLGVDVLALDLAGWMQILTEWGSLVADPDAALPVPGASFADLACERASVPDAETERARRYWDSRDLPPGPKLPLKADPAEVRSHRFRRRTTEIPEKQWRALKQRAAHHGLSPTGLLLAAYALTLTRWGATDEFCLNTTLFDRPDDARSAHVVGDFTSTVLVRIPRWQPLDWAGFAEYAHTVNVQFWSDMDHRAVSGVQTGNHAAALDGPPHPAVFTSGLGLAPDEKAPGGWLGEEVFGISQTPQVLLDHIVDDEGGRLRVCWDFVDGVVPDDFVEGMAAAHARLLGRLGESAEVWEDPTLGWVPSFGPDEDLDVDPFGEAGPLLNDPVRTAAQRYGDLPALLDARGATDHSTVDAAARALAARLAAAGVGPGHLVAVAAPKGRAQVVALLGVAASGAGYVPVEPAWPAGRVASVCEQAGIRHAVVTADVDLVWPMEVTVHSAQFDGDGNVSSAPTHEEFPRPAADDLAYVIFTSGSTGRPKGVAIEHRAARTTIDDLVDRFPIGPSDRMLALSAFSFDLSVHDVFAVLGVGGALVLPDADRQRDPGHWLELMAQHGVTLWNSAPALLEMLVEYAEIDPELTARALRSLRLVFLSADWIPVTLPDRLRALAPGAQVVSLGGATEASIWSICYPIGAVDPEWRSIPYGRALRGQSFQVLGEDGSPMPVGEPGELYIGGDGLARCYVGDDEQTAQRFTHHPVLGQRLYRTGDLGRWRHDGTIEFLGRVDRQVKIRGHRIELGEIESVLDRVPSVRKSVALSVPGPDDRPRLVAHIVPADATAGVADKELVAHLRERVPEYMVPSRFSVLAEFPVTANGKIDYAALPNPYRRPASAPPPPAPPAEPQPSAEGLSWLEEALTQAGALGLEVAVTAIPGTLAPSDAMEAAAAWSRATRDAAARQGIALREQWTPSGLVQLVTTSAAAETQPDAPRATPAARPVVERKPQSPRRPIAEIEQQVAEVFRALLGPDVDATTPFFALGATSLTLVLAHRQLAERGWPELTVVDLFAHPSVGALAEFLAGGDPDMPREATSAPDPQPGNRPVPRGRRAARLRAQEVAG